MSHSSHRRSAEVTTSRYGLKRAALTLVCIIIPGCAQAPLERAGTLSSYDRLKPSDGVFTKSHVHAETEELKKVKTVRLLAIGFSPKAASAGLSAEHRDLVANAANRALCNSLSRKFRIVPPNQPADLTVSGTITYVATTDGVASAASQATSIASSILMPIPVPIPRIPIGMGGLAVEAEARDAQGRQVAALVWARGADAFTSKPRMSNAGDAYDLTAHFSDDFSQLLKHGTSDRTPATLFDEIPSWADVTYAIDGKTAASACAAYGDGPGLIGTIGSGVGAPPEWTDNGRRPNAN